MIKPRWYQRLASWTAAQELKRRRVILIQAPTQTGKTLTVVETMRKAGGAAGGRCLVVTPRIEISRQWAETFRGQGMTASLLGGGVHDYSGYAICSTMDSARNRIAEILTLNPDIKFLVLDEGHHTSSPSGRTIFHTFQQMIPEGLTILTTATTGRADGQDIAEFLDAQPIVVSEDIATLSGALMRYDIVGVKVGKAFNDESIRLLLNEWEKRGGKNRQTIFFMDSIAHVDMMVNAIIQRGSYAAGMTGQTSDGRRRAIMADYAAGRIAAIVNVLVLTEGLSLGNTSMVVIASMPATPTPLIQKAGRALGKYPGKEKPVIIIGGAVGRVSLTKQSKPDKDTITRNRLKGLSAGVWDMSKGYEQGMKDAKRILNKKK